MKYMILFIVLFVSVTGASSCYTSLDYTRHVYFIPPTTYPGQAYTMFSMRGGNNGVYLETFTNTILEGKSEAQGRSCLYSVLTLVGFGDSSIDMAIKRGRIAKVSAIEFRRTRILNYIYSEYCTVVYGVRVSDQDEKKGEGSDS